MPTLTLFSANTISFECVRGPVTGTTAQKMKFSIKDFLAVVVVVEW